MSINNWHRVLQMIVLIFAGELVFSLPFHLARFFRPSFLELFNLSNTNLGDVFAVYGLTAMVSYFFGGLIADKISARKLMTISLLLTAFGGLYMSTFPNILGMMMLYGYWGITTIFLFWAAMLKATREWGGDYTQGKAFGLLDGGRGLLASVVSALAILIFANFLPSEINLAVTSQKLNGFRTVILFYSALTAIAAILIWMFLPEPSITSNHKQNTNFNNLIKVLSNRMVWLHAAIIICAYSTYKGLDNTALYAYEVLGMNAVEAAKLFTYSSLARPIAAILAGFLADRIAASYVIFLAFFILIFTYIGFMIFDGSASLVVFILINIFSTFFMVFAIRGIYFALVNEIKTPKNITGTTIGIVSFVGFTPDIFFGSISGRILDANPGITGHQNYFLFLTVIALIGVITTWCLRKVNK
ncbi:MAG: MFS transporter [Woeseiaceae bacterium]|nr:MFS transporter [Woeseiaceae bacterium]|tara:strand:- start:780 stop:2027 length:1248 start_codon:yes stop_codon:yes gene_type:complete